MSVLRSSRMLHLYLDNRSNMKLVEIALRKRHSRVLFICNVFIIAKEGLSKLNIILHHESAG